MAELPQGGMCPLPPQHPISCSCYSRKPGGHPASLGWGREQRTLPPPPPVAWFLGAAQQPAWLHLSSLDTKAHMCQHRAKGAERLPHIICAGPTRRGRGRTPKCPNLQASGTLLGPVRCLNLHCGAWRRRRWARTRDPGGLRAPGAGTRPRPVLVPREPCGNLTGWADPGCRGRGDGDGQSPRGTPRKLQTGCPPPPMAAFEEFCSFS